MLRRTDFFKLNLIILFISLLSACSGVAPWERGHLAKREMLITPEPVRSSLRAHVFDSKEASSGGLGTSGGGCGCN